MPGTNQAWRCTVCGYVHRGGEPPEACPVCGAPRELFEPQVETPPAAAACNEPMAMPGLRIRPHRPQPPGECPACGATADCFEPVLEAVRTVAASDQAARIVIVGPESPESPPLSRCVQPRPRLR